MIRSESYGVAFVVLIATATLVIVSCAKTPSPMESDGQIDEHAVERQMAGETGLDSSASQESPAESTPAAPARQLEMLPRADVAPPQREVPSDGCIVLTDCGYRDWGPELVHYRLDTMRFPPDEIGLTKSDGSAVPFQVDGNVLTFVASVAKGESAVYRLASPAAEAAPAQSPLSAGPRDGLYEVSNEHLSIRMPLPGATTFDPPADAADVTPPILKWSTSRGALMGAARFVTKRAFKSQAFSVVRNGPACFEYEARYTLAPRGEYVWRLRLSPEMPLAVISEDFDLGEVTGGEDMLMIDLHAGWQPKHVGYITGAGEQLMPRLETSVLTEHVAKKETSAAEKPPVGGVGAAPMPYEPEPSLVLLEKVVPGGKWGGLKGGVQLWDGDAASPGEGRNIGLVTLSVGSWRRAMSLDVWHKPGVGITVGLPLGVRRIRWSLDIADDFSPFSTHEHDEGLSPTYARREWGLFAGPGMVFAQAHYGHIGLDRYKDWVIDWPEGKAAQGAYPGALFKKEQLEELRQALDRHPHAADLQKRYLISGRTEDAIAGAKRVIEKLKNPYQQNDFFLVGLSNYRKVQLLYFVDEAEDALACGELPQDLRDELRRRLALYAYVTSDADFNPRGSGVHLGNNNMTINRTLALGYFAPLLVDHPQYEYWMDRLHAFTRFKLASQTSPCGSWIACPAYQLYAPAGGLNICINALRNRGIDDLRKYGYHKATLRYLANLTMRDQRYGDVRILPGMGNSANMKDPIWGVSIATYADDDPEFAGWLKYIFGLAGADIGATASGVHFVGHPMYYLPGMPERPEPLKTEFFPAYGVAFRAHTESPLETAMLLRAGMNWSHWDTDALNVVLYGKGAPLSPGTGYQYYAGVASQNNSIYHNRVKVGKRDLQEVFGRVDGAVSEYGFGGHADYAVADRFYPKELFDDGGGEMHWRRHVEFLKSATAEGPSYFVMRDTFPGGEDRKKWWHWLNLEGPERASVDGTAFDAMPVEKLLSEEEMPSLKGQTLEMRTEFDASTWIWFATPHQVKARLTMEYGCHVGKNGKEHKTVFEAEADAKQDFTYVVYPRGQAEAAPECTSPAPGVLRIKTRESTDYVFVGDEPFSFNAEGVEFTGRAGALRVFEDRVAFCMNAGDGRIGYRGHVFEGNGPFERVVKTSELRDGLNRVGGGYAKKRMSIDIGKGITVRGEGPFEARLEGESVVINTKGRKRVLHVTQPEFIVRPQLYVDGQEWMASWTDYPSSGWGAYQNTWLIGLSVPEGEHEMIVRDLKFPKIWTRTFEPLVRSATER